MDHKKYLASTTMFIVYFLCCIDFMFSDSLCKMHTISFFAFAIKFLCYVMCHCYLDSFQSLSQFNTEKNENKSYLPERALTKVIANLFVSGYWDWHHEHSHRKATATNYLSTAKQSTQPCQCALTPMLNKCCKEDVNYQLKICLSGNTKQTNEHLQKGI